MRPSSWACWPTCSGRDGGAASSAIRPSAPTPRPPLVCIALRQGRGSGSSTGRGRNPGTARSASRCLTRPFGRAPCRSPPPRPPARASAPPPTPRASSPASTRAAASGRAASSASPPRAPTIAGGPWTPRVGRPTAGEVSPARRACVRSSAPRAALTRWGVTPPSRAAREMRARPPSCDLDRSEHHRSMRTPAARRAGQVRPPRRRAASTARSLTRARASPWATGCSPTARLTATTSSPRAARPWVPPPRPCSGCPRGAPVAVRPPARPRGHRCREKHRPEARNRRRRPASTTILSRYRLRWHYLSEMRPGCVSQYHAPMRLPCLRFLRVSVQCPSPGLLVSCVH